MIKIENVSTAGFDSAVRGMRNPMNSWEQSDSAWCKGSGGVEDVFCIGKNDFELMQRLAKAGTDHRKYLRMISVYADVTAPLYWWKEFDTYKVGTVANSCSTMHKIHAKEFMLDDFSYDRLLVGTKKGAVEIEDQFSKGTGYYVTPFRIFALTVNCLNKYRDLYLQTGDKKWWEQMIQLLPSSYNQKRTVMLNYEVLANIYYARKNHKLQEWQDFCKWIETLPYTEVFTGAALCEECREKPRQKSREYCQNHRTEGGKFQLPATLCWDCKNAVPAADRKCGCSWSQWFRPVEGWEAIRKDVRVISGGTKERLSESYIVKKCPQFAKD